MPMDENGKSDLDRLEFEESRKLDRHMPASCADCLFEVLRAS